METLLKIPGPKAGADTHTPSTFESTEDQCSAQGLPNTLPCGSEIPDAENPDALHFGTVDLEDSLRGFRPNSVGVLVIHHALDLSCSLFLLPSGYLATSTPQMYFYNGPFRSRLDGIWGLSKASWGVLVSLGTREWVIGDTRQIVPGMIDTSLLLAGPITQTPT